MVLSFGPSIESGMDDEMVQRRATSYDYGTLAHMNEMIQFIALLLDSNAFPDSFEFQLVDFMTFSMF